MLTGTCADCHRVTTLVEGPLPLGTPAPAEGEEAPSGAVAPPVAGGPGVRRMRLTLDGYCADDGMLEVACAECETTTTFIPEGSSPPRGPPRERSDRYERPQSRDDAGGEGSPNARPCRQCGAPLKFTTDAEGVLTGECTSCGNRFTLPPDTRRRVRPRRPRWGRPIRLARAPSVRSQTRRLVGRWLRWSTPIRGQHGRLSTPREFL